MGDVYMNAYCTIAAHAAHHADHGFLQESMQREKVVAVGGHANGEPFENELAAYESWVADGDQRAATQTTTASRPFGSEAFFVARSSDTRHHLDRSELSSRGWALQERILSPFTVHFGPAGSLYLNSWLGRVEHVEAGFEPSRGVYGLLKCGLAILDRRRNRRYPSSTTAALSVIPRTYHGWYEMLTQYSACFLTNPRDKLIALSGIVQRCEGLIGDTYTGGIWINNFIHCLLWLRQKGALEQDVAAPAPTWSWASVKRKIQYCPMSGGPKSCFQPEITLVGDASRHRTPSVLDLDGAVRTTTELHFTQGRVGLPPFDNVGSYLGPGRDTTYWNVHYGSGQHIGWASLDYETRTDIYGLVEGIICIRVASFAHDGFEHGLDGTERGYMVLFISYSAELDAWQRVGMGQISDRSLFDGQEATKIRLA